MNETMQVKSKARTTGSVVLVAVGSLLFCAASPSDGCNSQPVNQPSVVGPIIGVSAVIGLAVAVPIIVHHVKHTVNGCVIAVDSGLEVQAEDQKRWSVTGATTDLKVGEKVSLHGNKMKQKLGDIGDQMFVVQKVHDKGTCAVAAAAPAAVPASAPGDFHN